MLVSMVLLAGGCGPNPPGESDGQGAGAVACLDAPMLLHAGSADERPYAIPWADGRYLVGTTSPDATYNVLEPCSGDLEPVGDAIDDVVSSDGPILACDDGTGEVYIADAVGNRLGGVITVARECELTSATVDGETVWLALSDSGQPHLFDEEGTYATVEAIDTGGSVSVERLNGGFVVLAEESLWLVDAETGAAEVVATEVADSFVRGSRVFFLTSLDESVRAYDPALDLITPLPATLHDLLCTLSTEGDWYMVPASGQSFCSRHTATELIQVSTGEAFTVPDGFQLHDALSADEVLLVGDAAAVWAPGSLDLRVVWPHPIDSVTPTPVGWGVNVDSVVVKDERPDGERRVVVPLDGSEPFGIFGEHPSGWAYYGDGDVLIGRTPDFELVRYDRETDELEVLAPKIVDAFYFQENTDRGHPAQLIYEVGDLDDAEVPREFWTMPLSE